MKRIIVAALAALLALPAAAACTWADGSSSRVSVATCTTGTESAPTFAAYAAGTTYAAGDFVVYNGVPWVSLQGTNVGHTPSASSLWWSLAGLDLANVSGFAVHAETAGTMTAGGVLKAYLWNAESKKWNSTPDLDLTVAALARQGFAGFKVEAPTARILFVPSGVGLAVTIYLNGVWVK